MLIHSNLLSIYQGVSRQDLSLRQPNHCEEMVNAYPTVQYGLKRRNPTVQLSTSVIAEDDQFTYTYDRGLSGASSEQYVITIDRANGFRVFDIVDNSYRTVNLSASALSYIESSNYAIGFSATTIQDTTFISNKEIIPLIGYSGATATWNNKTIEVDQNGFSSLNETILSISDSGIVTSIQDKTNLSPSKIRTYSAIISGTERFVESSVGATIAITIDGTIYSYSVGVYEDGVNIYADSIYTTRTNIYKMLTSSLDKDIYRVSIASGNKVKVAKMNGTAISLSYSIAYPSTDFIEPPLVQKGIYGFTVLSNYNIGSSGFANIASSTETGNVNASYSSARESFIWIKSTSIDTAFPYTYTATLTDDTGATISSYSIAGTNTATIAQSFATWANGISGFSGTASGSVCKITRSSDVKYYLYTSDTYGSQASVGIKNQIATISDVPRHFPFKGTVLKVGGVQGGSDVGYWMIYNGDTWIEHYDPSIKRNLVRSTMPHKLVRNADFTFTLSEVEYDDIVCGDNDTQSVPNFVNSSVRDIFFTGGRLGFLSVNGISLTQASSSTNFFRTTVIAMLDDSAITTYVDSSRSVGLEYAIELQNVIVLFGDKQQFVIDSSKTITPSTLVVSPIASYEIYKYVRPIQIGDSILFITTNNGYSSIMEMTRSSLNTNVKANNVSSHITTYIPTDITQMVASITDNTVMIRSKKEKDTIYIYKFLEQSSEKIQEAWSKWVFNMNISSMFVFSGNLYMIGSRYQATVPTSDFTFFKTIQYSKDIDYATFISFGDITTSPSFERLKIDSTSINQSYKDVGDTQYDTYITLSEFSIPNKDSGKEIRGSLLLKTLQLSSTDDSIFSINVYDKERNTERNIPSEYCINRKPFISGNSKNMVITIQSDLDKGFQISGVSIEAQYDNRSKSI